MGSNHITKNYLGRAFSFVIYMIVLSYFLFFSEQFGRTTGEQYQYNLVLFQEIRRFWVYQDVVGKKMMLINILGNVMAFVPFGYYFPLLFRRFKQFHSVFIFSFLLSLLIESIQLISRVGCFDVDDMLLNTIGGVVGYILYRMLRRAEDGVQCSNTP